ncbi:MAG TPA: PilZ domain-containing protein [bacterium]
MDDAKMFIERRGSPRYEVNFPSKYCFVEDKKQIQTILEHSKKEMNATVRDISLEGMQIALDKPLKIGDVLVFEIPLPGSEEPLAACAEVVWANGNIGGLHFLLISNLDLMALKIYLKKLGFRS